jgi:hypothetical protein
VGSIIFVCITRDWLPEGDSIDLYILVYYAAASHRNQGLAWSVTFALTKREIHSRCRGWSEQTKVRITFNSKDTYIGTYSKYVKCFFRNCMPQIMFVCASC